MKKDIQVHFRDTLVSSTFDVPNYCPHCGQTMSPHAIKGFSNSNYGELYRVIGILLQCTIDTCKKYFSLEYKHSNGVYHLKHYSYRPPIKVVLPENIEKVSSQFVTIYTQATKAETEKLDQIAGVGYRKATEFLIKDYAIRNNPSDKDKIEEMFLGKVINEYLSNFPKLQNLAKASTWIGNDETHYVRRHEDKDIKDMKSFILAAAQFIAADYDADLALEFVTGDNN